MLYYLGQAMGIIATICCIIQPLFRKKLHMLICVGLATLFFTLNLILIGRFGSAAIINGLLVIQSVLAIWHLQKGKPVTTAESILFLVAFVGLGLVGFQGALDLLPIGGAVFSTLSIFQRSEQKTRLLVCLNAICFFSYYVVIGSTSMLAELGAIITTIAGMLKHRKK